MDPVAWRPRHNPWAIALTVTLATFMEVLDTSVANVSLPHIAGNLSVGIDESTWILTSYLVSNAVVLPLSGWLSVIFGRKRFYMGCVVIFTVSSLLCGLAPNLPLLIVCRILQGAGGGGLQPSEQAILADTFPPERRAMAFAVYGMAVVLAPVVGPTLGGYITDNTSWRWIFFINIPAGLVSLVLTSRLVEDPPYLKRGLSEVGRIDHLGLGLIVIGLGTLQYILDKGEREDWFSSQVIVTLTVLCVVTLLWAIIRQWVHPSPILELRLLRRRNFAISFSLMFLLGLVLYSTTVLLPQFLQTLVGYTAGLAGRSLSLGGLVIFVLLPGVGQLLRRVDARWLIGFGCLATVLSLLHMANAITLQIAFSTAVTFRVYQSVGLAFLFVPINAVVYAGMPQEKSNQISAMVNVARNLGGSIGISLATVLIAHRAQARQVELVANVSRFRTQATETLQMLTRLMTEYGMSRAAAGRAAYGRIYAEVGRQAMSLAYIDTILVLAALSSAMLVLVAFLRKSAPPASGIAHH